MLLGVLCGLGVRPETLEQPLRRIIPERFRLEVRSFSSCGIAGLQATVTLDEDSGHGSDHDEDDARPRSGRGGGRHEHRSLADILDMIRGSSLPEPVKEASVRTFSLLAEVEGRIHGVPPPEVRFHEVGATDSVVDVIGCHLAYHLLQIDAVLLSPLPVGGGVVRCAHGVMPVPAPATAELLKRGFLVAPSDEPFELVTPTGAALLATWPRCGQPPAAAVSGIVNSFGHLKLLHGPDLLRGMLLDARPAADGAGPAPSSDDCLELECDMDDASGEVLGAAVDKLFAAGALDVRFLPEFMKKQRPAYRLSLSCRPADRDAILQVLFSETTTFGVREHDVRRHCLKRSFRSVSTPYGLIRVKLGVWRGRTVTRSPEFEDCRLAAERCRVSVREVMEAASAAALSAADCGSPSADA